MVYKNDEAKDTRARELWGVRVSIETCEQAVCFFLSCSLFESPRLLLACRSDVRIAVFSPACPLLLHVPTRPVRRPATKDSSSLPMADSSCSRCEMDKAE